MTFETWDFNVYLLEQYNELVNLIKINHAETSWKTAQPQGLHGSGLVWLIRFLQLISSLPKGARGCLGSRGVLGLPKGFGMLTRYALGGCTHPVAETSAGYYWLESLCKGLVASLCNHTSEVWYCAWSAHVWLGSKFFWTFTQLVGKVCDLWRVKTGISAVLTIKSGSDPHMST
jgi:hypothetical protein